MKPIVFLLAGPTGSGKSDLALKLSQKVPIEIVNGDSLAVYRYLDIGTAKPTQQDQKIAPHHLLDVLDPDEVCTAGWYARQAHARVEEILARKKVPLIVGGSGFYLRAFEHPPVAPASSSPHEEEDEEALEELRKLDRQTADRIHPNDRYRIQRALALVRSGQNPRQEWERAAKQETPYELRWIGIEWDRKLLYDRINTRVEKMFETGLKEETQEVVERFPQSRRRLEKAIGYGEALSFLEGTLERKEALTKTQTRSRNYAKRQLTWFRKEKRISWLPYGQAVEKALGMIQGADS